MNEKARQLLKPVVVQPVARTHGSMVSTAARQTFNLFGLSATLSGPIPERLSGRGKFSRGLVAQWQTQAT